MHGLPNLKIYIVFILDYPEDGGSSLFRNVGTCITNYTHLVPK
jgi:hypothetical protein